MIEIKAERSQDERFKKLKGQAVKETDASRFVTADTLVTIDGEPQLLYKKLKCDISAVEWAARQIKYAETKRTAGMATRSATFGYMPRRALFQDFCHKSDGGTKHDRRIEMALHELAKELEGIYAKHFPLVYAAHKALADEKILPEWKLDGSVFSSGIVNKDNQLPYHTDAGNFKGVYSNMVGLKKGINGGHLVIPELDLKFEIADKTLIIFNGQEFVHGVTPIIKTSDDAHRFTIVYYTMEQMWKCLDRDGEIKRIRTIKSEREAKRLTAHPVIIKN
jgi:hypothetical protein